MITLSNIGDVILSTPVIDVLKKEFPQTNIDIISGLRAIDLFKDDPTFRYVLPYNKFSALKDKIKFIAYLRKQKYDMVVDLRNTLIPYFLNVSYRTSSFENNKQILHMRDKHLKKLDKFKLNTNGSQFHIYISKENQTLVDDKLKELNIDEEEGLIAISPGARSELKRWTKEGFISVIKQILSNSKYKVVLIGDNDDLKLGEEILSFLSNKAINLIGQTSLPQLAHLLKKCSLLLTNDSACLHMASAVGTKTLAIFGPTNPQKYGPLSFGSAVIQKNLSCIPCELAQCRFNRECMKQIKPQDVLNKVREMI